MTRPAVLMSLAIGVAVASVAAPLTTPAEASVASVAAHSVVVTPATSGTFEDLRVPLVGSPLYLVYRDSHVITDSDLKPRDAPLDDAASRQLLVRTESGTTTTLGTYPDDESWSLSGTTLAAADDTVAAPHRVDYWNVATDTSGHLTLPTKSLFVGAAPDGVLYVGVAGTAADSAVDHLYLRRFTGAVDDLGVPFPGAVPSATPGDDGVIVTAGNHAKYLTFANPTSLVTLSPKGTNTLFCDAVVGDYAACHSENGNGDIRSDQIIPLDGSAATRSTQSPGDAALSGSTLLWTGAVAGSTTPHLFSVAAGSSSAPSHSSVTLGYTGSPPIVTAYGGAVGAAAGDSALDLAHSSSDIATVLPAKRSPVSAATFSLTSGRVAYNDDQIQGNARVSAYSTHFTTSGSAVTLAPQTLLKAGTYSPIIATSGSGSVYAVKTGTSTVSLTVVTPKRTHTITGVLALAHPTLSGKRLLYFTAANKAGAPEIAHIYSLTTGTTTKERSVAQCCLADGLTALSGDTFAYVATNNSIWVKHLGSGKTVQVRAAPKHVFGTPQVFANGDHVGWAYQTGQPPHLKIVDGYRNVRTMSKAVSVHKRIWQLASTGVVLDNDVTAEFSGGSVGNRASFGFRTYAGHTFRLLGPQTFVAGPQVAGRTVGWIGAAGRLRLAHLP
jgi:hypothetical protein